MKRKLTDEEYKTLERKGELFIQEDETRYRITLETTSPHYARCDRIYPLPSRWDSWITAPKNKEARPTFEVERIATAHGFTEPFCFFCGRKKEELGYRETLTCDHISRRAESKRDDLQNQQILCSACHKLKNWAETYITFHLARKKEKEETP